MFLLRFKTNIDKPAVNNPNKKLLIRLIILMILLIRLIILMILLIRLIILTILLIRLIIRMILLIRRRTDNQKNSNNTRD